jgi:hypothetical protein
MNTKQLLIVGGRGIGALFPTLIGILAEPVDLSIPGADRPNRGAPRGRNLSKKLALLSTVE